MSHREDSFFYIALWLFGLRILLRCPVPFQELIVVEFIEHKVDGGSDEPRQRIREEEHEKCPVGLEDRGDPQDPKSACAEHRHDHGRDGHTHTALAADKDLHPTAEEVRQCNDQQSLDAVFDRFRLIRDIDAEQRSAEDTGQRTENDPDHGDDPHTVEANLADLVELSGADVLTREGQSRLIEGVLRHVYEALDLSRSGAARHDHGIEGVDRGLDHDV